MVRGVLVLGLYLLITAGFACAADDVGGGSAATAESRRPFLGGFLRETRIVYPQQVGNWRAVGERIYDEQASGVSVRYLHGDDEDRWIDLFFYPAGVISPEDFAKAAGHERDMLRQARVNAGAPDPEMGRLRRFRFKARMSDGEREKIEGFSTDLAFVNKDQELHSAMTLLSHRLYFIKGRYSVRAASMSRGKARDTLEEFTAQLFPLLTISSSGECWNPLPIEALASDAPDPQGAAITSGVDGATTDFLLADRVVSRDPEGDGAKALMLLGMAMQGRMAPGCDGTRPINPDVAEGMREIRIEYRAPVRPALSRQ